VLADEVATYLAGAGLGLTVGDNLFTMPFPLGSPDSAVSVVVWFTDIVETFGESLSAPAMETQHFKVIAREGPGEGAAAQTKAYDIYKKLRRLGPVTLSGVKYHNIQANPPMFLSDDEADRPRYHFDAIAHKAESP
jgi:hypothetical protein